MLRHYCEPVGLLGQSLIIVPLLAVLAPMAARGLGRWIAIPIVVFELMLGILVGPAVLGWAEPNQFISLLSQIGLAALFFVAGTEIEFDIFRTTTGGRAILGWVISLAVGIALGALLSPLAAAVIIGISLSSTALGTILPGLSDSGDLKRPFGRSVSAIGAVGEFGPLLAISIFLGGRNPGAATIVVIVFAAVAAVAIVWAMRAPQGALHRFVTSTLHTSGQFAIRVVMLILAILVAVSILLDLEMLLGAFVAGVVWRLIMRDADEHAREEVESKIQGLAFGFFVPVFFIYTGITFDLSALLAIPGVLWMLPLGLVALFVVRGLPSMLAAPKGSSARDRIAVALLGATGLPIIVAATQSGVDQGIISSGTAALLVGIGMLSVLLFPALASIIRRPAS